MLRISCNDSISSELARVNPGKKRMETLSLDSEIRPVIEGRDKGGIALVMA